MKSKMNVLGRVLSMILAVALTVTTVFSGFSRKTLAAENNVITVEEGEKNSVTFGWGKSWILGNVTRIPRHELPQTLDFSDFLPLFT